MFYYFDEATRRCTQSCSISLIADSQVEIVSNKNYKDMSILTYVTRNNVNLIEEDDLFKEEAVFGTTVLNALAKANKMVEYWEDQADFGEGVDVAKALEMTRKWREYRFCVKQTTALPMPIQPLENNHG
jgi:hypothetical protein